MSFPSFGPTPPYNNPPIQPQNFQPSQFIISDISIGYKTLVRTVNDMNYVVGQLIRLLIPQSWGCYQLNEVTAYVLEVLSPNVISLQLDSSTNVNEFKSGSSKNFPQIVAVGDLNSGIISSTGNINFSTNIPGSFINIS